MAADTSQRAYWNGPAAQRWIGARERMDRGMASITAAALELAAPRPGERVLDVGCGYGTTSLLIAERVAPGGSVVGVDISAPMIDEARGRAPRAGSAAVSFVVADAGSHRFDTPFDLLFSRFGVMFFEDPAPAFENLAAALAPGGRMAFVCWQGFRDNPWAFAPLAAARDLLPPTQPFDPEAPGPFAFADRDRLRRILAAGGFAEVSITGHADEVYIGASAEEATDYAMNVGPLARMVEGVADDVRAEIRLRVASVVEGFVGPGGVAIPAAVWLVHARR